jgi:transposase
MNDKNTSVQMKEVRERTAVIMKVQGGLLSATEAAQKLGISRKTYYELEAKALSGIMQAINPGQTGRPKNAIDPEKLAMQKEIKALKQQVALNRMKLRIRDLFKELNGSEKTTKTLKKTN